MLSDSATSDYRIFLYVAHEYWVDSDPAIIPYKVINLIFTTLYGIITE